MRRYSIVSGILLILPIIDFAVAAPVLVQEKRQAGVNAVHVLGDAIPMLGKRVDELPWDFLEPAGGWADVTKPLPSIPEEPSAVSSPDRAPQSLEDEVNELWLRVFGHPLSHSSPKPEESSIAHPSSSSSPSGPADSDGRTDVNQPLSSIPEEPSLESSPDHAPPNPDDEFDQQSLELLGGPEQHFPEPEESSAAHQSSSLPPLEPADGGTEFRQPPPSVPEEPSPVSTPDHTPRIVDKVWI